MTALEHAREAFVLLTGIEEHDEKILAAMILAERKACAELADELGANEIAAAIRGRA